MDKTRAIQMTQTAKQNINTNTLQFQICIIRTAVSEWPVLCLSTVTRVTKLTDFRLAEFYFSLQNVADFSRIFCRYIEDISMMRCILSFM